jgi:hypothetical protein
MPVGENKNKMESFCIPGYLLDLIIKKSGNLEFFMVRKMVNLANFHPKKTLAGMGGVKALN